MQFRRLTPLLVVIMLLTAACSPLDLFGLERVPQERRIVPYAVPHDEQHQRSTRDVAVFYTEHEPGYPDSQDVLMEHYDAMSSVIGFWYQVDPKTYMLQPAAGHDPATIADSKALAESYGLATEMLIYNFLYGSTAQSQNVLKQLITNQEAQNAFIKNVTHHALTHGFEGVSLDFEHLHPAYRDEFSTFIETLATALQEHGMRVSISVGAKTWDDPNNGWAGGYDYARLGAAVDRFVIMTYDEHGFSSGPGPIASSPWVERVVRYAVTQVPADKIMLGIAGYGFDWNHRGGAPRYLSHEQAEQLRQRYNAPLRWDDQANSPWFTYTDATGNTHEVWFENADSTSWKLDLIERYDLRGMAMWRLGLEDPNVWHVVKDKFIPLG